MPGLGETLLAGGLLVVVVAIIVSMVRSDRSDPKMNLLSGLLKGLPTDEGEVHEAAAWESDCAEHDHAHARRSLLSWPPSNRSL